MSSVRHLPLSALRPACTGLVVVVLAAVVLAAVVLALPATAQDSYDDPLAFRRIDAAAPSLTLILDHLGAGRTHEVTGRRLLLGAEEIYLPSADVADAFGARRIWQDAVQRLTLELGTTAVRLTAGSRLVVVGQETGQQEERLLPVPVLASGGELWLPMVLVTDVLAARAGLAVGWDPASLRLELGNLDANVTGLELSPDDGGTTLTVICSEPLGFRASHADQGLVEIKIYDGRVDPAAVALTTPQGLVQSVRSRQEDGYAVVAIQLDGLATSSRTEAADGGRRIVMAVADQRLGALPEPEPRGQAHVAVEAQRSPSSSGSRIQTIVLDPGHGGSDAGVVGPTGSREKDVNLEIARALARYLQQESELEVVLTREDDRAVELAARAEIANRKSGDLFVSLHCNGWFDRDASGLETYFLSPAKTDWSKSVEQAENQSAPADDVEFIVWELVQNKFISSSSELAEVVQHEACLSLGLPDRGVKQAGFRVLVGAYMPAILVEVGFLSNPTEETLLLSRDYQQRLARALGEAILAYCDRQSRGGDTGGQP